MTATLEKSTIDNTIFLNELHKKRITKIFFFYFYLQLKNKRAQFPPKFLKRLENNWKMIMNEEKKFYFSKYNFAKNNSR